MASTDTKIEVQNVNQPDSRTRVDRPKYEAMKAALLLVLPTQAPGMTYAQAKAALLPHLPEALFPGGNTAGWWIKCVQLDLEAKGTLHRAATKPLKWHKAG